MGGRKVTVRDGGQDRDLQLQRLQDLPWPWQEVCSWRPEVVHLRHSQDRALLPHEARNLTTKWTVQYRRINKKGSVEQAEKKRRAKKSMVKTREIVGLTAEMLEKKRSARPAAKDKQRDAALKELKSRKCQEGCRQEVSSWLAS